MKYEYSLNEKMRKKYGFSHLICNGWFGVYADEFNKKYVKSINRPEHGHFMYITLSESEIDEIISDSACVEY